MKAVRRQRLMNLGTSHYDAAKAGDGQRSTFLAFPLTGEKEFTQYTRRTILRKKRALEANLSAVGAIIEKVGRYSVGKGRFPIPQTKDTAWNELTAKRFDEWASNKNVCDAAGMMTFWQMQKWVAENRFGEGEAFAAKVNSNRVGAPQPQLFDNGEIEYLAGTGTAAPQDGFSYWDGVKLNAQNRIVGYSVRTLDGGGYQDVSDYDMIHVCKRKRPNQFRAVSPFHGGANSAVDSLDLKALETASAKLHSALGVVVTKKDGGGVGPQGLTGNLKQLLSQGPGTEPGGIGEDFLSGAAIAHLAVGEDIKLVSSSRPSMNTLEFLAWLYRDLSVSTGVPVEIWWDMSQLGGAPARITLADVQWFFDDIGEDVDDQFDHPVYVWWLASLLDAGDHPYPEGDDEWWKVAFQGPAKLTADAGNTAASEIAALGNGLDTWANYWAARGKAWKPQIKQRIDEVRFLMDEAKRQDVPIDLILQPKPGAASTQPPEDPGASAPARQPIPVP